MPCFLDEVAQVLALGLDQNIVPVELNRLKANRHTVEWTVGQAGQLVPDSQSHSTLQALPSPISFA